MSHFYKLPQVHADIFAIKIIMIKFIQFFLFSFSISPCIFSQTVETVNTTVPISCDDMYVDSAGIIYTGKGGLSNKTDLGRVTPDGSFTSVAQGMKGPISIAESPNGLLYVTNYDDNSIKTYDRNTGEVKTVATGLDGPSGITIDAAGDVYAANWGGAPNYNGHQIHRLMPDGTFGIFKDSPLFSKLQGIAIDDEGYLYTANTQNGRVFKINTETGEMETLVTLGQNVVNMEFNEGYFYMASIQSNKIYRMDKEGEWSTFAGTGISGGIDGPIETATFNNPIGVGFSTTGDTLYVSDSPNRLRRIIFDGTVSLLPQNLLDDLKISVCPNPSSGLFKVELGEFPFQELNVKIVDVMGNVVFNKNINQPHLNIDLSNKIPGYYFLVVTHKDLIKSIKVKLE